MIAVNGSKPLTVITKSCTLNVAAVLDPPEFTSTLVRPPFLQLLNEIPSFISRFFLYQINFFNIYIYIYHSFIVLWKNEFLLQMKDK